MLVYLGKMMTFHSYVNVYQGVKPMEIPNLLDYICISGVAESPVTIGQEAKNWRAGSGGLRSRAFLCRGKDVEEVEVQAGCIDILCTVYSIYWKSTGIITYNILRI